MNTLKEKTFACPRVIPQLLWFKIRTRTFPINGTLVIYLTDNDIKGTMK